MKKLFIPLFLILFPLIALADTIQVLNFGPQAINTAGGVYFQIMGSAPSNATETSRQTFTSPAGVLTNLRVKLSVAPDGDLGTAGTQSVTIAARRNEASLSPNVSCVVSEDNTTCTSNNSIALTASQRVAVAQAAANTPDASNVEYSYNFIATQDNATWIPFTTNGSNLSQSATEYINPVQNGALETVENTASFPIPTSGTLSNLTVRIVSAPGNGAGTQSYTMTVYQNGSPTGITCSVSESTSNCADAVNTVTIAAGDVISLETVPANTPATTCKLRAGLTFTPTVEGEFVTFAGADPLNTTVSAYHGIYSSGVLDTTETNVDQITNVMVIKALYAKVTVAPGAGASWTFTVRDDAAATTLTCVISGAVATTCNFADSGNYVTVNSQMSLEATPSGTPAAADGNFGILGFTTPPRRLLIN